LLTIAASFASGVVRETTPLSSSTKAASDFVSSGLSGLVCAVELKLNAKNKRTKAIANFVQLIFVLNIVII